MNTEATTYHCAACGKAVQMGPHRYEGKWNSAYQITVCDSCHAGNWDGWAPHLEARVTKELLSGGKSLPARNSKHLLPRE